MSVPDTVPINQVVFTNPDNWNVSTFHWPMNFGLECESNTWQWKYKCIGWSYQGNTPMETGMVPDPINLTWKAVGTFWVQDGVPTKGSDSAGIKSSAYFSFSSALNPPPPPTPRSSHVTYIPSMCCTAGFLPQDTGL